ncbi:hypothetical protein J3E69DRAFT_348682 [Trichoderma sp. SZMC 28015]
MESRQQICQILPSAIALVIAPMLHMLVYAMPLRAFCRVEGEESIPTQQCALPRSHTHCRCDWPALKSAEFGLCGSAPAAQARGGDKLLGGQKTPVDACGSG